MAAFLFVLLMPYSGWAGDTGTYRIDDYAYGLPPRERQRHRRIPTEMVGDGGHIPWITVVSQQRLHRRKHRGAARSLSNASEGGWCGVRIDLDRDYTPGQSFEVWFSIEQSGLFHVNGENLELDFTPGWYDRAVIGQLTVTMNIAAQASEVRPRRRPPRWKARRSRGSGRTSGRDSRFSFPPRSRRRTCPAWW